MAAGLAVTTEYRFDTVVDHLDSGTHYLLGGDVPSCSVSCQCFDYESVLSWRHHGGWLADFLRTGDWDVHSAVRHNGAAPTCFGENRYEAPKIADEHLDTWGQYSTGHSHFGHDHQSTTSTSAFSGRSTKTDPPRRLP